MINRATRLFVVEESAATANVHITVGDLIDAIRDEVLREILTDLSRDRAVRPTSPPLGDSDRKSNG